MAVPEQLAGKSKSEDRVMRRDSRDRIFVISTTPPKQTERKHFQKAAAYLLATVFCFVMMFGDFMPRLAAMVAIGYIAAFFSAAIFSSTYRFFGKTIASKMENFHMDRTAAVIAGLVFVLAFFFARFFGKASGILQK